MKRIRVKQIRSKIRRPKNQKLTLEALGLKKMDQVVEHDALCLLVQLETGGLVGRTQRPLQ